MYLVTFTNRVEIVFQKSAGKLTRIVEPNIPYVFSTQQYHKVIESNSQIKSAVLRQSVLDTRIRPFRISGEGKKQKVAFYTGAGGYGDQIMAWPAAKAIADRGYELHVISDPGNNTCWNFDWVKSVEQLPVRADELAAFDHLAFYEIVTNVDEHDDQLHPTDNLLHRIGIDHALYPSSLKRVRPNFTAEDITKAGAALAGRPCAIYQLSSSSVVRSLSPDLSRSLAVELATAFPQLHWFATYDDHNKPEYKTPFGSPSNLELKTFGELREFMAAISLSQLVVAIDSLAVHVAGTCGVPCVGLWGPVDPRKRVAYYDKHLAVWQRQACAISPCFGPNPEVFPPKCPPVPGGRKVCAVLEMDTKLAVKAAKKLLNQ